MVRIWVLIRRCGGLCLIEVVGCSHFQSNLSVGSFCGFGGTWVHIFRGKSRTSHGLVIGRILRWLGNQWICCHIRFLHSYRKSKIDTFPNQDNQDIPRHNNIMIGFYIQYVCVRFIYAATVSFSNHVMLRRRSPAWSLVRFCFGLSMFTWYRQHVWNQSCRSSKQKSINIEDAPLWRISEGWLSSEEGAIRS